ncbi:ABC transporter ATP-binding protein [Acholeplasma granularum]|uniref:ABC transporter ATP-binding protein n=1 Tax=Acholeplasma granularum TaxID=264635 RepID=UPI0004AE063B|nr:ATP-binding cassette domain-containing protein [Acholeplasma granularum]
MKRPARMLYQPNKIGYYLMLIFIIANLVYTIQSLETMATTLFLGTDTMINIAILLAGFLASAKIKVYDKRWSYIAIGFALFQIVRMFWTPGIKQDWVVYLAISSISALLASFISLHKINIIENLDKIGDDHPLQIDRYKEEVITESSSDIKDVQSSHDKDSYKLSLKSINKIYANGVHAVKNFNLDIKEREFIVLVGPSGCGKSTTLRMIAGLESISNGKMFLYDKQINKLAPSDRDVAMIFQDYALYGHMTSYENMGFSLRLRHENDIYIHDKVVEASKIVQLDNELKRLPKNMSGGQRQRVALGRSIVRNAQVFLMDEPLSNLDAKLRDSTRKEIVKLHNDLKATIVYVTHDQIEAMTMATRIVVMNEGYIQQVGTPSEIYNEPSNLFVASFMGMPPMNFFEGEIMGSKFVSDRLVLELNEEQQDLIKTYKDRNIVLGIRPEYFSSDLQHLVDKNWIVDVEVQMIEYSGSSQVVTFELSGQTINAKLNTRDIINIGDVIKLAIKRDAVLFFDKESTLRITNQCQKISTVFDGENLILNDEKLRLPEHIKTTLKDYVNKQVQLNFRLEDCVIDEDNGWMMNAFDAIPYGDFYQVIFTKDDLRIETRMRNDVSFVVSNDYKVNFNFDKVHFKDIATNKTIEGPKK